MEQKRILNLCQRSSRLQAQAFREGTSLLFPVSAGKVIKSAIVTIRGYVAPVFTVAPTLHPHGIMDALISSIQFVDDAGNTHKKVTPEWMRYQQRYLLGKPSPELYKVNSTTLTSTPTEGNDTTPFAIGTTGQNVAFVSSVEVSFENKLSTSLAKTFLALRGNIASYIQIDTRNFVNLEKRGGTNLTSCTGSVTVEVKLIEAPTEMSDIPFEVFRQSYIQSNISGQLNSVPIELSRQGRLQGLRIALSHGAGWDRVSPDIAANTRFKLIGNGSEIIRDATLLDLQYEVLTKRPQDNYIPGCAYMSLLNNSDYDTALPSAEFRKLELEVTTDSSMTFSPSALLEIGVDEILSPFSNNRK